MEEGDQVALLLGGTTPAANDHDIEPEKRQSYLETATYTDAWTMGFSEMGEHMTG
jgi:hypothetical protein